MSNEEKPYIKRMHIIKELLYNKNYGDERICKCGHMYYRHFDPYEDMRNVGCKYCGCLNFEEGEN